MNMRAKLGWNKSQSRRLCTTCVCDIIASLECTDESIYAFLKNNRKSVQLMNTRLRIDVRTELWQKNFLSFTQEIKSAAEHYADWRRPRDRGRPTLERHNQVWALTIKETGFTETTGICISNERPSFDWVMKCVSEKSVSPPLRSSATRGNTLVNCRWIDKPRILVVLIVQMVIRLFQ